MKRKIKLLLVFGIIFLVVGGGFLSIYLMLYFGQRPEDAEIEIWGHKGDFEKYDFISGAGSEDDPYIIRNLVVVTNKNYALAIYCESEVIYIINCTITNNYNKRRNANIGISLNFQGKTIIENNTIQSYGGGIVVDRHSHQEATTNEKYVTVKNNHVYDVSNHLYINSQNAEVMNNTLIRDTEPKERWIYGSYISIENNLSIINNTLVKTGFDFNMGTFSLNFSTIKIEGNQINGLPLLVVLNEEDLFIENISIGQVAVIASENITLSKLILQYTSNGISILLSNNCTIENNKLSDNIMGIRIFNCKLLSIRRNIIQNHYNIAINTYYMMDSDIFENTCTTSWRGIDLTSSSNNNVSNNTVSECNGGITVFRNSYNNTIKDNLLQNNRGDWGIFIVGDNCSIYNNTLIDNNTDRDGKQGYDSGTGNKWFDGTTGNKWSDWSGSGYYYLDGNAGNYDPYPSFP
ncbi:MAG: hypothetical protein HGN29_09300 [Asgard group archaeon]|nr:hypothetical protein [Asgard group archaeon]